MVPQLSGSPGRQEDTWLFIAQQTLIFWLCVILVNLIIVSLTYLFTNIHRTATWVDARSGSGDTTVNKWKDSLANRGRGWVLRKSKRKGSISFVLDGCCQEEPKVF